MRTIPGTDSAEQLRRIQTVADAALAHLELAELLDELLARIRDALAADTAAFLLLDEETNELVPRGARGLEEDVEHGPRVPVGAGFAGRVAAGRQTVAVEDVDQADILDPSLHEQGVRSLLGAPLIVQGRVIGVVHVGTLTPRRFTAADEQLLQLVADRAALAIDHGRSYEAARALAEQLRRLQAVTDVTLEHLSNGALLDELVLRVREILAADTCAILLVDEDTRELVARAAAGLEEEVEAEVRIPLGRGFAGRIAAERRPVFIPRIDETNVVNPILREKGLTSLLGAPLLARERLLGVIHVGSIEPRTFTREETELLQRAAERAALGVEHALLHQRLIELDRVRNRFVAIASHELRTPTTAILGSAATLEARSHQLTPEQENELRRILAEQSRRLATLVEQLLDLSRLETHAVEITPVRRRARELVDHALTHVAADQRAHVRVDVDPELELEVDAVVFDRVLSNLLSNALRHGEPPVVVSAREHGRGGVVLAVEDAGAGVPADVRGRVFDEFTRSAEAAGRPGSGLGLAIARSYAHAHGGELVLDETAERGTRFELVLPGARP
jgi:signal transduction histidine kinase